MGKRGTVRRKSCGLSTSSYMKHGQKKEFLNAYDRYADALYRHAYFRVFSESRAEELMQESFLRAWRYMSDGEKVENLRAFLYRTLNNLIVDEYRKKREESLDVLIEESPANEPAEDGRESLENRVLLAQVRDMMRELPEEDRELLTFRYIDDMSPAEIAETLGMTANSVSVRLHRIIAVLKETADRGHQAP
jgi:RNA polymerase sigma-70 factor, ECF subfamily